MVYKEKRGIDIVMLIACAEDVGRRHARNDKRLAKGKRAGREARAALFRAQRLAGLGVFGSSPKMADSVGMRRALAEKRRGRANTAILC